MSKRRKLTIEPANPDDTNIEVDLAPMLALMVTLIPIMLLSTVFVRVTLIETPLPQVVQKAVEEDRKKKDREVNITLNMMNQGFKFQVLVDGKTTKTIRIPKQNNTWNLNKLYKVAHQAKLTHPQVFRVDLHPDSEIKYDDIVKVIDSLRTIKKDDQKATITDKKTLKKALTDVMFPDVNFANVVEG